MEFWFLTSALWLGLAFLLCRARCGGSVAAWTHEIAFMPRSRVSAHDLFGYLLSAHLAILEHDDFNQLGSKLSRRRVDSILARYWNVSSPGQCLQAIDQRLRRLGTARAAEEAAYAAWHEGAASDSCEYKALLQACKFLARDAGIIELGRVREIHLNPLACDVQDIAYLVRLGFSAGHLPHARATEVLARLQEVVKRHYTSWEDFSLSALVGMGVRSLIDPFDLGDWRRIARSHQVLLAAEQLTLSHAAGWAEGPARRVGEPAGAGRRRPRPGGDWLKVLAVQADRGRGILSVACRGHSIDRVSVLRVGPNQCEILARRMETGMQRLLVNPRNDSCAIVPVGVDSELDAARGRVKDGFRWHVNF